MKRILITGGAGFIGSNTAAYFLKQGNIVTILDNLARKGSEINLTWLKKEYSSVQFIKADIRNFEEMKKVIRDQDVICHFAGQVAVTTSVHSPREDFEINALGTLNLLEAVRTVNPKAIVLYSSTNKVYGGLEDTPVEEKDTRYVFKELLHGVSEDQNLDFHSPYGCSKGAADQYVRDYARIYGLKTIVFRQSCIYGPRQFGIEDQGWLAWFIIALITGKSISIYGNGKQVRDVLHVDDLIQAYEMGIEHIDRTQGQIFNIGGGPANMISIWYELQPLLEELMKIKITSTFADWRPGDQPIFVADIRKAKEVFGWEPKIGVKEGITRLHAWVVANKALFTSR